MALDGVPDWPIGLSACSEVHRWHGHPLPLVLFMWAQLSCLHYLGPVKIHGSGRAGLGW